jgi:hypothetical protein
MTQSLLYKVIFRKLEDKKASGCICPILGSLQFEGEKKQKARIPSNV